MGVVHTSIFVQKQLGDHLAKTQTSLDAASKELNGKNGVFTI